MARSKNKKTRYTAAQRRSYWIGVGAGLAHNQNGVPYSDMRTHVVDFDYKNEESFSAGFTRSYDAKSAKDVQPRYKRR